MFTLHHGTTQRVAQMHPLDPKQVVHLSFFIIPNAYTIAHPCSLFHPLVTWSFFIRSITLSAISTLWLSE